jgi:hypothetical protein
MPDSLAEATPVHSAVKNTGASVYGGGEPGTTRRARRDAECGLGITRHPRWMTAHLPTSADGWSSTIHNPYYRHCQN